MLRLSLRAKRSNPIESGGLPRSPQAPSQRRPFLVIFLFGFVATSFASQPQKFLEIEAVDKISAKPGTTQTVAIPVAVEKPFHIHSNPPANPQYIPTELKLKSTEKISVGAPSYPKGKPYRLQGSPTEISVYSGKFKITIPITLAADIGKGDSLLEGTLRFQACDEKICFFPKEVSVTVPVHVQ